MSAAYLCPILQEPQWTDDANFLVGGLMWFYSAGTTTPLAVYTDSTATTAWTNPIVLDARGETGGEIWLLGGSSYKIILESAPLSGQVHGFTISTYDNVTGINDSTISNVTADWITFGGTPTFLSSNSFSVTSDQRATFQVNRRIKSVNSAGLQYGTISAVTYFAGVTTITLRNDAANALDAGLSSVQYGFVETDPSSIPVAVQTGTTTSGSNHEIYIDWNGTNLLLGVDNVEYGEYWPISEFSTGTRMAFNQASAPTGWTQDTSMNNYAFRLVSGAGGGTGGSVNFTTAFASQSVIGSVSITQATGTTDGHVLTTSEIPSHSHGVNDPGHTHTALRGNIVTGSSGYAACASPDSYQPIISTSATGISIQSTGGNGAHTHTFTAGVQTGTFTGTPINLAVKYADFIVCSKN